MNAIEWTARQLFALPRARRIGRRPPSAKREEIVALLRENDMTPREVADAIDMTPAFVANRLSELFAAGRVTRRACPEIGPKANLYSAA